MVKALVASALANKISQPSQPLQPLEAKGWGSIPRAGRNAIIFTGSAVAIIGGFFLIRYLNKRVAEKDEREAAEKSKKEYKKLLKQGKTLSKPESSYTSVANTIEKLLDGCESSGSEYQVVENIIRTIKKPIDWAYLKQEFGVRKISDCGTFGASKTEYDLATLLNGQLDTFMIYDLNIDGYKDKGTAQESIDIIKKYFSKIGVSI